MMQLAAQHTQYTVNHSSSFVKSFVHPLSTPIFRSMERDKVDLHH